MVEEHDQRLWAALERTRFAGLVLDKIKHTFSVAKIKHPEEKLTDHRAQVDHCEAEASTSYLPQQTGRGTRVLWNRIWEHLCLIQLPNQQHESTIVQRYLINVGHSYSVGRFWETEGVCSRLARKGEKKEWLKKKNLSPDSSKDNITALLWKTYCQTIPKPDLQQKRQVFSWGPNTQMWKCHFLFSCFGKRSASAKNIYKPLLSLPKMVW